MGVINLGLLVDKIKKKLEGAGFIKNTDYATASKAGVVKVGDGLSVTETGVLSAAASGGTDTLYTQPATPVIIGNEITLSAAVSNYKAIIVVIDSEDSTSGCSIILPPVAPFKAAGINYGGTVAAYAFTVTDGTKIKCTSGTNAYLRWKNVYGLK